MFCHEHEIPELHEALFVHHGAAVRAVLRPLVIEDLRRGATRPRHTHLPEVVLPPPLYPVRADTDGVEPDLGRLVVGVVHGEPHPVGVEAESLGHELEGPGDSLLLEVLPKLKLPSISKKVRCRAVVPTISMSLVRAHF